MLGWPWVDTLRRLGLMDIGGGLTVLADEYTEEVEVEEFDPEPVWLVGEPEGEDRNGETIAADRRTRRGFSGCAGGWWYEIGRAHV